MITIIYFISKTFKNEIITSILFSYIVTPSPLRKERKSGFLTPSIALNFLIQKPHNQLLFHIILILISIKNYCLPIINYGGGVDASQRFVFDCSKYYLMSNLKQI